MDTLAKDIKKAQKKLAKFNNELSKVVVILGEENAMYDDITYPVRNAILHDDGSMTNQYYKDGNWHDESENYLDEDEDTGEVYFSEYRFGLDINVWNRAVKKALKIAEMENEAAKEDRELTDEEISDVE